MVKPRTARQESIGVILSVLRLRICKHRHIAKKVKRFVWTADGDKTFDRLKHALLNLDEMGYPLNTTGCFSLNVDLRKFFTSREHIQKTKKKTPWPYFSHPSLVSASDRIY